MPYPRAPGWAGWQEAFAPAYEQLGMPAERADTLARMSVAPARWLLLEAIVADPARP